MKTVTIKIKNLIGTVVVIGDKESASAQIKEIVNDALLKVIYQVDKESMDKSRAKEYNSAVRATNEIMSEINKERVKNKEKRDAIFSKQKAPQS